MRNFNVLYGWDYLEKAGINPYRPIVESTGISYDEATALDEKSLPMTGPESGLLVLHQFVSAPSLPDFLARNASKYSVAEQSESIDGEACWVVEWPVMDKIWVNVDRGYTVRRRVYHWKPAGPLARRVDNSDLREVKPGLWFCFRQTVERYGQLKGDRAYWEKVINRSTYEVRECDLSRAPDALTNLRVPAGSFVTDAIRNLQYKASEEGDPLERPLGDALQWGEKGKLPVAASTRGAGLANPMMIAGAVVLVFVALVLVALFSSLRRRKARRPTTSQPDGWSSDRRRRLQFSLRGFLIAVTVGCTWLGWNVERARQRGRAIDAVSAENTVLYDYYDDFLHKVQNHLPRHFWSDIRGIPVHIYFHRSSLSPAMVAQLSAIRGITRLRISQQCSAAELERLGGLGDCGEIVFTQGVADGELQRLQRRLPKTKLGLEQADGSIMWRQTPH